MQKLNVQALPEDAIIYEFCFKTDEDQIRFLSQFQALFARLHENENTTKIRRLGVMGIPGSGKSTFALGLLNAFGIATRDQPLDPKNRGDWYTQDLGTVRIYDNFTNDYHRFNNGQNPEGSADIVIVEHADIDPEDFDCLTVLSPGDGAPCDKNMMLIIPAEFDETESFENFLDSVEDLFLEL